MNARLGRHSNGLTLLWQDSKHENGQQTWNQRVADIHVLVAQHKAMRAPNVTGRMLSKTDGLSDCLAYAVASDEKMMCERGEV